MDRGAYSPKGHQELDRTEHAHIGNNVLKKMDKVSKKYKKTPEMIVPQRAREESFFSSTHWDIIDM